MFTIPPLVIKAKMSPPDNQRDLDQKERHLAGAFSSSMFWNIANTAVSQTVTMGVFIFLTYKLDPVVFGVFALCLVFTDYFNFQARTAAVDALFQRRREDKEALDSAFWAVMGLFIIATGILAVSGGVIASLTGEPRLTYVLPVMALTLLPVPFAVPPVIILMRRHDFKGVALRGIMSTLLSAGVAIAVAFSSWPEWALVAQRMTNVLVNALFYMLRAQWVPGPKIEPAFAIGFLKDMGRIFSAQSLAISSMRLLDVIIAVSFGTAAVGFMRIASRFTEAINAAVAQPISSICVLMLTGRDQTQDERTMMYLRLTQMAALVCLPVFAGVALTGNEITRIFLDNDYAPVGPILTILCMVGMFAPITYLRNAALTAVRKLNLLLGFSIIDLTVLTISALLLSRISLEAVVASLLVVQTLRAILTNRVLLREMHTTFPAFVRAILPAYAGCIVMALGVLGIAPLLTDLSVLAQLTIKAATGASLYFGYLALFHRNWSVVGLRMLRPENRQVPAE